MRLAIALAVALSSSPALAESADSSSPPSPTPEPTDSTASRSDPSRSDQPSVTKQSDQSIAVALAFNAPVRWGSSIGVSGYLAFAERHAVRFNFARWDYAPNPVMPLVATLAGNDWEESSYSGRIADIGAGYQFYSRRMFEGLTLEAGVFRRDLHTRTEDDAASPNIRETKCIGYAGRTLVGWSWLWADRLLVATAAGVSYGRFAGTERTANDYSPDPIVYMERDFVRYDAAFEAYLRIGLAFGM